MKEPEFDRYSASYRDLLSDPIRNRFAAPDSDFFHGRKCDLNSGYLRRLALDAGQMSCLDVGCGQGKLISLLRGEFARVAGYDIFKGMIGRTSGPEVRLQEDPCSIPSSAAVFDLVLAVCVYHHVPEIDRMALTRGIAPVLKPERSFAVIEHNPHDPETKPIVSRLPVDRMARLLSPQRTGSMLFQAGLIPKVTSYFWFFPERVYENGGAGVERWLSKVPLGGQYAVFAQKPVEG